MLQLWSLGGVSAAHPAIVLPEQDRRITHGELDQRIDAAAEGLATLGVTRGDRIAISLPNGLAAVVAFIAASRVATAAPLNPAYKESEFRFFLDDTRAKFLLVPPTGAQAAVRAAGTRVVVVRVDDDGYLDARSIPSRRRAFDEPSADDIALVLHTSGSTGLPKRVPLTHGDLAISIANIARTYALGPSDVSLCAMPLFHVHGLVASTLATLATGGTVVIPQHFNALAFWRIARQHRVTWYSAAPTLHQLLVARHRRNRPAGAPDLRFIRSCSAPLAPQLMEQLEIAFDVPVVEAYGMTEAAHQVTSNPLPPARRIPGTVGPPRDVRVGIVDEDGNHLGPQREGEVVLRGANILRGYEDSPEANRAAFVDGWFKTGDQGYIDADGYLRLNGRIKELINRGGEKIAPREIDEVLLTHPAIAEVVSFGVPHRTWGEEVAAVVVPREPVTEATLISYCGSRLADFKCPTRVHITDRIPRTASGKILRRVVAEAYRSGPPLR